MMPTNILSNSGVVFSEACIDMCMDELACSLRSPEIVTGIQDSLASHCAQSLSYRRHPLIVESLAGSDFSIFSKSDSTSLGISSQEFPCAFAGSLLLAAPRVEIDQLARYRIAEAYEPIEFMPTSWDHLNWRNVQRFTDSDYANR